MSIFTEYSIELFAREGNVLQGHGRRSASDWIQALARFGQDRAETKSSYCPLTEFIAPGTLYLLVVNPLPQKTKFFASITVEEAEEVENSYEILMRERQ